jgi:hypothetical protein
MTLLSRIILVVLRWATNAKTKTRVDLTIGPVSSADSGKTQPMRKLILTTDQKAAVSIAFKTAAGHPATIVGVPVWALPDVPAPVVTLEVAPDGLSATVKASGLGDLVLTVTAEGDPTPGVDTITEQLAISVVGAEAKSGEFTLGTPELNVDAAPATA